MRPEVSKTSLKDLLAETKQKMLDLAAFHQMPEADIDDRLWNRAALILGATTREEAELLSKKVLGAMEIHCLSSWAKGKIPGPCTPEALEKKAKAKEGIAKMLDKMGNHKDAEKQRRGAQELQKSAAKLREEREHPKHKKHPKAERPKRLLRRKKR